MGAVAMANVFFLRKIMRSPAFLHVHLLCVMGAVAMTNYVLHSAMFRMRVPTTGVQPRSHPVAFALCSSTRAVATTGHVLAQHRVPRAQPITSARHGSAS